MKIKDGLNLQGKPAEIPDCSRDDLPQFFVDMGFTVGAEIGVYRGEFTEKLCKAGLSIYAIDPWMGYYGAGRSERRSEMQNTNYNFALQKLSPFNNCTIIRKTSMDALNDIEAASLDFVYIDGDHRFRYIAEDLSEWSEKVKKGGIVCGHDYFCTSPQANNVIIQVKAVVDAYIGTYQIPNFYVFGKGDKTLSWMFIKP